MARNTVRALALSALRHDSSGRPISIPLASWLTARGRCRYCDAPLSSFYPLVEIGAAIVGALAFGVAMTPFAIPAAVLGWWLLGLALIDLRSWRLPDVSPCR